MAISTKADFDEIKGARRARIHYLKHKDGKPRYSCYLYRRGVKIEWENAGDGKVYKDSKRAAEYVRAWLDDEVANPIHCRLCDDTRVVPQMEADTGAYNDEPCPECGIDEPDVDSQGVKD